jgi:hypothetical protein
MLNVAVNCTIAALAGGSAASAARNVQLQAAE